MYGWCVENGLRPLLIAKAVPASHFPAEAAVNGCISLDLSSAAVRGLVIGDESIKFDACFGGVASSVVVSIGNVLWIGSPLRGIGLALHPGLELEHDIGHEREKKLQDAVPEIDGSTESEDGLPGQLKLV